MRDVGNREKIQGKKQLSRSKLNQIENGIMPPKQGYLRHFNYIFKSVLPSLLTCKIFMFSRWPCQVPFNFLIDQLTQVSDEICTSRPSTCQSVYRGGHPACSLFRAFVLYYGNFLPDATIQDVNKQELHKTCTGMLYSSSHINVPLWITH
jgi:hypothetical protein